MDVLLQEQPELFVAYAVRDAEVCARYAAQLISMSLSITGDAILPLTLASVGLKVLENTWAELGMEADAVLGMETVRQKTFDKRLNRYRTQNVRVPMEQVHWHTALAVESYHGGRGEQFWFGPGEPGTWTDYDLCGAYPTVMAEIRTPDWRSIRVTQRLEDFTERTLGVANVAFEFPETVRFPTMPVRTANGIVFLTPFKVRQIATTLDD